MLDWSTPVRAEAGDWALQMAPVWEAAVTLADPWRQGDPLAEQGWREAVGVLDTQPEPTTVGAQNARWRAFVDALWSLRNAVMRRRWQAHRALAARQAR